jgi:hypothetical protein
MNTQFPNGELPGLNAMNDTLAFVKKLWGGMQVPGMVTPTVSLDELDKKIQDLKTVESWLNVNMNMLRGTIQALEVQRATIATFKAMSENFAQAMKTEHSEPASASTSTSDWPPSRKAPSPTAEAPEPAEPVAAAADVDDDKDAPSAMPLSNPAAWWNLLQDQFKQAVSNAKLDVPVAAPAVKETPAKVTPAAKTSAKAAPKAAKKAPAKPRAKPATKPAARG